MAELAKQEVDTIGKERGTGKNNCRIESTERNGMCASCLFGVAVAVPEELGPGDSSFLVCAGRNPIWEQ